MGGGGPGAAALLEGDAEADHHDVLALLGVSDGLDGQFSFEADAPLAGVHDEEPAGGSSDAVGDLAVGGGQFHLLGDDDWDALNGTQLAG